MYKNPQVTLKGYLREGFRAHTTPAVHNITGWVEGGRERAGGGGVVTASQQSCLASHCVFTSLSMQ
jgi:hypothetical protein